MLMEKVLFMSALQIDRKCNTQKGKIKAALIPGRPFLLNCFFLFQVKIKIISDLLHQMNSVLTYDIMRMARVNKVIQLHAIIHT